MDLRVEPGNPGQSVYLMKKLVGALMSPLTIALLLLPVALLLRMRGRRRAAIVLFCCGAMFAWAGATQLVGGLLLAPLERQYPARANYPAVEFVVVLGSGYSPSEGFPVSAALDQAGTRRLIEGVRILQAMPGARLVVSGGLQDEDDAPATGYALLAQAIGLSPERIIRLYGARDTRQEAARVAALTQGRPFILVTSAAHMPRAMEYMRRAGGSPVAAPTGQRARQGFMLTCLLPDSSGLQMSEDAIHEYLGWLALIADLG
jgi:uncharacterized SAM-binding protein YcdF (DUF218 family)